MTLNAVAKVSKWCRRHLPFISGNNHLHNAHINIIVVPQTYLYIYIYMKRYCLRLHSSFFYFCSVSRSCSDTNDISKMHFGLTDMMHCSTGIGVGNLVWFDGIHNAFDGRIRYVT